MAVLLVAHLRLNAPVIIFNVKKEGNSATFRREAGAEGGEKNRPSSSFLESCDQSHFWMRTITVNFRKANAEISINAQVHSLSWLPAA